MKKVWILLVVLLTATSLFGCKKQRQEVTIETNDGKIVIALFPKDAPKTVANFLKLVDDKFYDGLTFHRVVPDFVVQGGDPRGNGTGGPGYTIKYEASARKHLTGSVAMARNKSLDSAGSQFYICYKELPHLDGQYTVFGQVISGMDVVNKIQRCDIMKRVYISSSD